MTRILAALVAVVSVSSVACAASSSEPPAQKEGATTYTVPADQAKEMADFYNDPAKSGCYRLPCSVSEPADDGSVTLTIPPCSPDNDYCMLDCKAAGGTTSDCSAECNL
jgi:hypothetical protein